MLGTLAIKTLGLLAALAAAAIASPARGTQTKGDPVPEGFPTDSQMLSYLESQNPDPKLNMRPSNACRQFESDCRYIHAKSSVHASSSIVYSCINNQKEFYVTGSCVLAYCNGKVLGLSRMIPTIQRTNEAPTFRKVVPCPDDDNSFCVLKQFPPIDKTPVLLAEGVYNGTCPHPPPIGNHHLD